MKEIKFNTIGKTRNYLEHLDFLFSDYNHLRKKVFSSRCIRLLKPLFPHSSLFLTHSATGGLEMIAQCIGIEPGDEVIVPSFTFVSTANAFVKFGAIPIFVDCDLDHLMISVDQLKQLISPKTKAVVVMHYMGNSCDMEPLLKICKEQGLWLIEDAATGFGNDFNGKALGSIGHFGVVSFDSTKHISAIQGGLLIVNDQDARKRMKQIYHIGTNRDQFEKGDVSYYDWVDVGSKYQMNELNAAFLFEQLLQKEDIITNRKYLTKAYDERLRRFETKGFFRLMPWRFVKSNIHGYYLLFDNEEDKKIINKALLDNHVESFSHYRALHLSPKGATYSIPSSCPNSSKVAQTILRLPLHNDMTIEDVELVCQVIQKNLRK